MRRFASRAVLGVAVALAIVPSVADAQEVAKTQFKDAKEAYDDGKFEEALQLFQLAWESSHSPNARLYVGRCFSKLGNYNAAFDELQGTLRDASEKIAEDPKYVETRNAAAMELVLLEPHIGRVIITVDDTVPDVKVTMNGRQLSAVQLGEIMTVAPGTLEIVATASDRPEVKRTVEVKGGHTEAVTLLFPQLTESGEPVPVVAADDGGLSLVQWLGIGVIGIGVGGLVTAGVSGATAGGKFGALEQACGDAPCPDDRFNGVIDSGKRWELIAYIAGGAGLAAIAGGTVMLLLGGDSEGQGAGGGTSIVPLPGGGVFSYRTSF